jgi:pyridoxal phosphate enzyme (YggS family)
VAHGSREQILENLAAIRGGIARAADRSGRDPAQITLVAVAKTIPLAPVRWAVDAGIVDVGENYVQALRAKAPSVPEARWHFVGTLQTNSAHHVAAHASVVQSVAGGRATERLARRAAGAGRTIDALIEVDFTSERTGADPGDVPSLVDHVASLEGLRLTGLMTVPPMSETAEDARSSFVRLRELRDRVREKHPDVLALSMGMSLDYEVAVEEGATMVRIGTALFGPRM